MVTREGYVKKTELSDYMNIRRSGIIGIKLREEDSLVGVRPTTGNNAIVLVTKNGKSITFSEKEVRDMGRNSIGVIGINLDKDDCVVGFDINDLDKYLLVISEKGYGKMTKSSEYKLQRRGGKGLIAYKVAPKTGKVVSAKVVTKDDELMMITEKGIIIRIETKGISVQGRSTSGVKLMNIKDSEVVAVAKYIGED